VLTLAGVLGYPVAHSRSPRMMAAAFAQLGLYDWRYLKLPIHPDRFPATVRALPASGYTGVNVTIPHKVAALEAADHATQAARAIGAANTLTFADGRIEADNTDAGGLLDAIGGPPPATSLVLGAGGAGRAAAWALREAGSDVAVWNRTPERAAGLAEGLGVRAVTEPGSAELLVNATSVGLAPGSDAVAELGLERLDPPSLVVDLVYAAEPTALCLWGEGGGARVVGGLEVLVRQGARTLEHWTGRPAPVETMRAAAESV
jgi:shikimate dehydrogenase